MSLDDRLAYYRKQYGMQGDKPRKITAQKGGGQQKPQKPAKPQKAQNAQKPQKPMQKKPSQPKPTAEKTVEAKEVKAVKKGIFSRIVSRFFGGK